MSAPSAEAPKHADPIASPTTGPRTTNPFAHSANVTISVPESVEIRLVDASVLLDYEIWSLVASILGSAVVGFLVAFFQSQQPYRELFLVAGCVFALLLVISALMARMNRQKIATRTRSVKFRLGEPMSDEA